MSSLKAHKPLPLAVVFWIYLVIIGRLPVLTVVSLVGEDAGSFCLGVALGGFYLLWAWSRAWRAAGRYAGPAVWPVLTKALVAIDVVLFVSVVSVGVAVLNGFEGFWFG